MKNEVLQLVTDTLHHLKKEGYLAKETLIHSPPPLPNTSLSPKQGKKEKSKEVPAPISKPKPPSRQQEQLMVDLIRKHLPHIELVEHVPPEGKVAIIVFDKQDLPFLKTLAKAIHDRFCPVALLDGEKTGKNLDSYSYVFTQANDRIQGHLLIKPASLYQNSPQEKKQLWNDICTLLSPKSS